MFTATAAAASNFTVIKDALVFPWRRRQWLMIPVFLGLGLYLFVHQGLAFLAVLSTDALMLRRRREERRVQSKIEEEGRNMYPLW